MDVQEALDTIREFVELARRQQELVNGLLANATIVATSDGAPRRRRVKRQAAKRKGNGSTMKDALRVLGEAPNTSTAVADAIGASDRKGRQKLSVQLARAKKQGYVARKGRIWSLTSAGKDYINA